ncbi:uncharacterized protein [Miscanthus floridulus]|uniref:uncharacterized protein n=1 Tax=Miscanthus floridulus TaxID=154761 RepID=UPI003459A532
MPRALPVATISAPRLVILKLGDANVQRYVQLGRMPHLQSFGDLSYCVYGVQGPNGGSEHNTGCLKLLQPIKTIKTLSLSLAYFRDIGNYQYVMGDMKVLPDHEVLYLNVLANGHSFGASSFHVLRMCVGIRMLVRTLLDDIHSEAQTPCPQGCVCEEQSNWKIEELSLINLQEIEILKLRGSEHEASFVKRLFNWATALNKITVFLDSSTTERKAKELFQMFESLSRPGVCMELYRNHKKVSYAP